MKTRNAVHLTSRLSRGAFSFLEALTIAIAVCWVLAATVNTLCGVIK